MSSSAKVSGEEEEAWGSWRVLQTTETGTASYSYQPLRVVRMMREEIMPEEENGETDETPLPLPTQSTPLEEEEIPVVNAGATHEAAPNAENRAAPAVPVDAVESSVETAERPMTTEADPSTTRMGEEVTKSEAVLPARASHQVIEADATLRQPRLHRYALDISSFYMDVVVAEPRKPSKTAPGGGSWTIGETPALLRYVPNAAARQRGIQRLGARLAARATHEYLPVLLGPAVLEECQQVWAREQLPESTTAATTVAGSATLPDVAGEANDILQLTLPVTMTPVQLLQRVQRGRPGRVQHALHQEALFATTSTPDDSINPYLEPDHAMMVQWLQSRGAKAWTTADVHSIWGRIEIPGPAAPHTDALFLSQLLLQQAQGNPRSPLHSLPFLSAAASSRHPLSAVVALAQFLFPSNGPPSTRLVLQYAGNAVDDDHSDDVTDWDVAYFGRSPFTVRVALPDRVYAALRQHVEEQAAQQEAAWQARRQLEAYRQQSGQSGYWALPSWIVAAAARLTRPAADAEDADLALAQRLATQDEASSGRRKTARRDNAGVFYGNQSNLTMKQLMDALLRSVSARPVPTLAGLLQAVPDDSSDPVKRTRTALGRLLYKRHQLSRLEVDTAMTDGNVWQQLERGPLWRMPPPSEEEEMTTSRPSTGELSELVDYLRTLQQTELQLRRLVLAQLTDIPLAIVATAGDDRAGSMESMDDVDFENPASMSWETEGHPLLHQRIYRPLALQSDVDETTKCVWLELTGFVPSVASTVSNNDTLLEKPSIGRAREPTAVERRLRFRAVPCDPRGEPAYPLILTEAQVRAGRNAAELYVRQSRAGEVMDHPFASGAVPEISLIPSVETAAATPPIVAYVVGHDRSWDDRGVRNKILVLPKQVGASPVSESFWTTLDVSTEVGGGMTCSVHGEMYTVQQFDFHSSSKAYQECLAIVRFLQRHPKAGAFQEPVDPIALGIPDYPKIIQHPMDVSTVLKKLERGDYSHIPPTFMKTASPVTRMLNGPFRNDVERIFDNAMLFNPPQDWIHQAASVVKKAVVKKIEQASSSYLNESRSRKQSSIYVDYDSDVDMYVYESDYDDEKGYSRKRRKRPGARSNADRSNRSLPTSEDSATRCIERGIRLQKMLSDTQGLRGPLSNLPIVSNSSDFSLPSDWLCRYKPAASKSDTETSNDQALSNDVSLEVLQKSQADLDELLSIHRLNEENEQLGTRRSTRATENSELDRTKNAANISSFDIEYIYTKSQRVADSLPPVNRSQVELLRERLHETYYAKLYHLWGRHLVHDINDETDAATDAAHYSGGSFPPYLGRVVPMVPLDQDKLDGDASYLPIQKWEIRESMVLPALRWIIRGMLYSEHLVQIADGSGNPLRESLLSLSENALVLPNHVYFIDEAETPFDVLDIKEMTRRKKQRNATTTDESEDEVELSEYEKARAERVARNTQRLQALGLA